MISPSIVLVTLQYGQVADLDRVTVNGASYIYSRGSNIEGIMLSTDSLTARRWRWKKRNKSMIHVLVALNDREM